MTNRRSSDELDGCLILVLCIVPIVWAWSYHWAFGVLTLAAIIFILVFIGTRKKRADARRIQWQLEQVAQRGAVVEARSRLINTFEAHPSDVKDLNKLLAVQELTYEHRTSF